MDEPPVPAPKRRYRWPYLVIAFLVLQALLIVVWMLIAVRHVEAQRDFSAPPTSAH